MSTLEERLKLLLPVPASDALRARIASPARGRWARLVPMGAAASGLVAVLVFAITEAPHGQTTGSGKAEAEFRKMEETLRSAKSLRIRFRRDASVKDPQGRTNNYVTQGTILLKEGNRLRFSFKEGTLGGSPSEMLIVADGLTMNTFFVLPDGLRKIKNWGPENPTGLLEHFAVALARESIAVPGNILAIPNLEQHLAVSDFFEGESESGMKTLRYKVDPFDARVWIDPKRHVPVKRVRERKELGLITETYDEVTLNPDLPDEEFKIPEGK